MPSHLPKNIATELLTIIPQIEPQIRGILNEGYSIPRPIDAKNVLSPSSPIAILKATNKIQFFVKEDNNLIIRDFESVLSFPFTGMRFFDFINPASRINMTINESTISK